MNLLGSSTSPVSVFEVQLIYIIDINAVLNAYYNATNMQIHNSLYSPPFGNNKAKKFDYAQNKTYTNRREIKWYFINHRALHNH